MATTFDRPLSADIPRSAPHETWSSRALFILAAAGSAVGLGNIWKFPYIAGENGGGAFVVVYLASVVVIGLPLLMTELLVGRRGGRDPITSLQLVAAQEFKSGKWQALGWASVLCAFLVLSFYSVVAGWAMAYVGHALGGTFQAAAQSQHGLTGSIGATFEGLLGSPKQLILWHTVFMALTVVIAARGVRRGVERATRFLMPGMLILLLVLAGFSAIATGQFDEAVNFLFRPDFSALTPMSLLTAVGHAFFTLSLGAGCMMAYGSYLPRNISIGRASLTVAALDTGIALLAGLAIFPLVFAHGLEPSAGPGLIFKTLPIAFAQMPAGAWMGTAFFVLLVVAALTSTISLLEPVAETLQQRRGWGRQTAVSLAGLATWTMGLAAALAFNAWSGVTLFGKNFFELLDFLTTNILMPGVGLSTAIFAGWVMSRESTRQELGLPDGRVFRLWRTAVRWLAPTGVAVILLTSLR